LSDKHGGFTSWTGGVDHAKWWPLHQTWYPLVN
jgi:hypothetical protein